MGVKFRFQDLKIWQLAIEITDELLQIADQLENKKLFRFAEQLRGAAISVSSNIVEGSCSASKMEFNKFLNNALRSFENANILIILNRKNLLQEEKIDQLLEKLDKECRMIINFKKTL